MYSIQRHLNYHAWANNRIAEVIKKSDPAIWDKPVTSSFPTIQKTIYHVWDAEVIWFRRIQGNAMTSWPSENYTGTRDEALNTFATHSQQMAEFFADKDRAFLDQVIHYKNLKGLEFSTPVEDILFHVVNHASFHRGQLVTMLRTLGVTELQTSDLIAYMRL